MTTIHGRHRGRRGAVRDRLRLQYLRIPNSGGPARPRNAGVAASSGDWIAFLDSDDWWKPERLESMMPFLGGDVALAYHRLLAISTQGNRPPRSMRVIGSACGGDPLGRMLKRGNPVPNSAAIVRRDWLLRIGLGGGPRQRRGLRRLASAGRGWGEVPFRGSRPRLLRRDRLKHQRVSQRQIVVQKALFEKHRILVPPRLRHVANSNFSYLMGSYALQVGDKATALEALRKVRLSGGAVRLGLALIKRVMASAARQRAR